MNVSQAALSVAASAQSKVYGATDPALTLTQTGLLGSDTLTGALTRAAGENVGNYGITQGTVAASGNYNLTFTGDTLNITPASLLYVATPAVRAFGAVNPTLIGIVTGFKFADTLATATTGTPVWGSLATATSNAGSYAINGSGLASGNYVLAQATTNATALTVVAAPPAPAPAPPPNIALLLDSINIVATAPVGGPISTGGEQATDQSTTTSITITTAEDTQNAPISPLFCN